MAERDFYIDEFDPSQMVSPVRRLKPDVGVDPNLRVHITFSSEHGRIVPSFALRGWRATFTLKKIKPKPTKEELAQRADNFAKQLSRIRRNGIG
jgi:hypothetical protein